MHIDKPGCFSTARMVTCPFLLDDIYMQTKLDTSVLLELNIYSLGSIFTAR